MKVISKQNSRTVVAVQSISGLYLPPSNDRDCVVFLNSLGFYQNTSHKTLEGVINNIANPTPIYNGDEITLSF